MILRDLRSVPAHFSAKTPDPRDRSQGSGAGLVGNYMKRCGCHSKRLWCSLRLTVYILPGKGVLYTFTM